MKFFIHDFDIIGNTPAVPHINHDVEIIRETESLADNMFEKLKMNGIKKEIMSELQKSIENFFQNELSVFKEKREELVSKSYVNGMVHIEKLENEIKRKDQIINHLLVSLESLTGHPNRNAVIDDTVTSPGLLKTLPQSNQTSNSLETRKGIDFVKDIIKPHTNKENSDENNNISNTCITSIKSQLELVRKEKHAIYLKQKCSEYNNKEKHDKANNDETLGNFKHAWPAGNCLIVGDSILTGIDEKLLSRNNQVVKVRDFRGVTIDDLRHHLISLLEKKPKHIILHIGTNDPVSKKSRQIIDELLQLKQYSINTLPTCRVIVSRPTIRTDNGKAALTLSNFNKLLGQLELDFIDNVHVKEGHLGKKRLHLNQKGKDRLELNFLQKLRNL